VAATLVVAGCGGIPTLAGAAVVAQSANPPSVLAAIPLPTLVLDGYFGLVPGVVAGSRDQAVADPALDPLDTIVHEAPLRLEFQSSDATLASWTLAAESLLTGETVQPTGVQTIGDPPDRLTFAGPGAGDWLLVATLVLGDGTSGTWFWHLLVPNLGAPPSGVVPLRHPDLIVTDTPDNGFTFPVAQSGCYVGTCDDIGSPPGARHLPLVHAAVDDPMVLSLSDGSGFDAWSAFVRPVDEGRPERPSVAASSPIGWSLLPIQESGDYIVTIGVTFDHGRGSQTWLFRAVIAAQAEPPS
jgi:hypothetical protein